MDAIGRWLWGLSVRWIWLALMLGCAGFWWLVIYLLLRAA